MRLITTILLCLALLSQLAAAADEAYISLSGLSIGMSRAELLELGLRPIAAEEQAADSHLLGFSMIRELPGERDLVLLQGELAVHVNSWFSRSGNDAADQPLYAELRERVLAENTPRGWMYPEYFSYEGFNRYESFIGNGGNLAFLGDSRDRVLENQMHISMFTNDFLPSLLQRFGGQLTMLRHEAAYLEAMQQDYLAVRTEIPAIGSRPDTAGWQELPLGDAALNPDWLQHCSQMLLEDGDNAVVAIMKDGIVVDTSFSVSDEVANGKAYRFYHEQLDRFEDPANGYEELDSYLLDMYRNSSLSIPSENHMKRMHGWLDPQGNVIELRYDWETDYGATASVLLHSPLSWEGMHERMHNPQQQALQLPQQTDH
ncbi:hypothetical protein KDL44_08430 [bacterium]|nr:hypothetical protein [bacterium]